MQPEPGELRILNQRYQPWNEIVLGMFAVVFVVGICGMPIVERLVAINSVLVGGVVGVLALIVFEGLLPRIGSVRELKLGIRVETTPVARRWPARAVERVTFAADPEEDYAERSTANPLREATLEIHSGRPIRLVVTQADADRLRHWAAAKGIEVVEPEIGLRRSDEPATET